MVIAFTGEKLAGKDTAAECLIQNYGADHVRYSHVFDKILELLNIPISRRNEIDLGNALRGAFGEGVFNAALKKQVEAMTAPVAIINGIRFASELQLARDLGATVIYITAPEDLRYQRFLERREKADDATQTREEFHIQESEPTEIGIPELGVQADYRIDNVGSRDELFQKVDEIMSKLGISKS